jgi:hypothetical protein
VKRRAVVMGLTAAAAVPAVGFASGARAAQTTQAAQAGSGASSASSAASAAAEGSSLVFDPDAYTEPTITIKDTDGVSHEVVYRFYKVASYVAKPVDATYQSLNVSVPVKIDGKAVDATDAPILLANAVGGYMPSSVANNTGISASGMGGGTSRQALALAAGYVVVEPGARGRTLVDSAGTYYGTAPAAIVDLKAAVRYVKFNKGRIPGNVRADRLLRRQRRRRPVLTARRVGRQPALRPVPEGDRRGRRERRDLRDGAWCPITDLEHSDMAPTSGAGAATPQPPASRSTRRSPRS